MPNLRLAPWIPSLLAAWLPGSLALLAVHCCSCLDPFTSYNSIGSMSTGPAVESDFVRTPTPTSLSSDELTCVDGHCSFEVSVAWSAFGFREVHTGELAYVWRFSHDWYQP
jgi:hypothetical protein